MLGDALRSDRRISNLLHLIVHDFDVERGYIMNNMRSSTTRSDHGRSNLDVLWLNLVNFGNASTECSSPPSIVQNALLHFGGDAIICILERRKTVHRLVPSGHNRRIWYFQKARSCWCWRYRCYRQMTHGRDMMLSVIIRRAETGFMSDSPDFAVQGNVIFNDLDINVVFLDQITHRWCCHRQQRGRKCESHRLADTTTRCSVQGLDQELRAVLAVVWGQSINDKVIAFGAYTYSTTVPKSLMFVIFLSS